MKRARLARLLASAFVACPALVFALGFGLAIAPAAGRATRPTKSARAPAAASPAAAFPAPASHASASPPRKPAARAPAPGGPQRTRKRDAVGMRLQPVGCRVQGPDVARFAGTARAARRHEVALSFDDGPSVLTQAFVRMLHARHVVATFFVVGEHISPGYRAVMREELRDGDAIGDHTWSHPDLVESREAASQLRGTREVIRRETAYTPCVFRPPYGAYNAAVVHAARALGLATVTWDVDPQDWALPGVAAIEQRVLAQVRPGSIVLSHDGGGPRGETLAAYPAIIAALRKRGYRFVTVPKILGFRTLYRRCATNPHAARSLRLRRCQGA